MAEHALATTSDSFVRRNREAELEAKIDEAEQRTANVLELLRKLGPADLERALNGDEDETEGPQ